MVTVGFGLLGLVLLALAVLAILSFTIFRGSQRQTEELTQLIIGVIEVLVIDFLLGVVFIVLASLFAQPLPTLATAFLAGIFGIGISQWLYVVPRSLKLRQQQRWARLKGVIIGAVIVVLLNGSCWILLTVPRVV
jgi:heme/copper-type cytochrome/quinol oxidase subunit 4